MPPSTRITALSLALSLGLLAAPASAARLEIQGGRSYMDSYATSAFFINGVFAEHRIGNSRFSWSPEATLGRVGGRDVARYRYSRYSTSDDVWLLAGGVRLRYAQSDRWYRHLFVSFQPAVTHGRTQALSSAYEFISSVGWQGRHFSVQLRHISNGSLHEPNRGETMALVGVGFDL